MTTADLQKLYRYNDWSNQRFFEAAASIPAADLNAARACSHGSLLGTLRHIVFAEWLWYVADRSRYMSGVNRVLSSSSAHYPVDFEASSDPTWETFRAFIEGAQEKQ